jgi:hypothetical protein
MAPFAAFQQAAGNLAVQAALRATDIQGQLSISRPDDPEEQEAERMAELYVARQPIARDTGSASAADWAQTSSRGGGKSLPPFMRHDYEAFLGADFSTVRIHTGPEAHSAVRALNAKAFTSGNDVYFGAGRFAPESGEGRKLLAHELAHVAQDRFTARVRRQLIVEGAPDADNDERLFGLLQSQPRMNVIDLAVRLGGLAGWRQRMPLSYAEIRQRAVARYTEPGFAALESHDAEVLALVSKANTAVERLLHLRTRYEERTDEDQAVRNVIDFYIGTDYVWGHEDVHGLFELSYSYFAEHFAADIHFDLRAHQELLAGSVEHLVAGAAEQTGLVAADAWATHQQRQAWTDAATPLIGTEVGERTGIFFNDSLELESLLDPTYGSADFDEMLAVARFAGRMTAVVRVGQRYHAFALSENYDRRDIYLSRDWDRNSSLVESGTGNAQAIVTSDGFVVSRDSESSPYTGGDQARDPMRYLEADTALLESGRWAELGIGPTALFTSMVRNLALVNLAEAERRMTGIVGQMAPNSLMDYHQGEALQRDTTRLREITLEVQRLALRIGDAAPTEDQVDQRDDLLMEMGNLVERSPAAAFFVRNERAADATSPVEEGDVEDRLAGMLGGDAAMRAIDVANERRENIAKVRRAMFDNPNIVLGFQPLFDPVFEHFSSGNRFLIRTSLVLHTLDEVAAGIRMAGIDLGLLIAGFATAGMGWIALGVESVGTVYGLGQLQQQWNQARLVSSMSELDVPGGFELASEEQAASARNWAIFATALNFLGMVGLAFSASRLMRAAAEESALFGRLARGAGVSEETIAGAFRTSWRGVRTPNPDALREIMLARLPEVARQRYANVPISVLTEEQWAARFGANSSEHAATQFATRASGELYPAEVAFRAQGNPFALQEEAAHIAQAADPVFSARVRQVADLSVDAWSRMAYADKLRMTRTVLELEVDAQERLLAEAQALGHAEALDDAFASMEDVNQRLVQLDEAIANPAAARPAWFDPSVAPTSLFNAPRLPRARGSWELGGVPGNCTWYSTRPAVRSIVGPTGAVRFRNGYPDFRPWTVAEVRLAQSGAASDFAEADARLASNIAAGRQPVPANYTRADFMHNGEAVAAGAEHYRRAAGLTWHHHQGGTVMLLVPTALHANIPHTGGASAARAASP